MTYQMLNLSEFLQHHKEIKVKDSLHYCRGSRYRVRLPERIDNDLCRFIGIIHGDGNLSRNRILIGDKNLEYHEIVLKPLFKRLFNLPLNLYYDKNRSSYYSHVKSSIVFRYIDEVLEIKAGSGKMLAVKLPSYLSKISIQNQGYYIAGLYDSEGSVKKRQTEINFAITSQLIWRYIKEFLVKVDIKYSTRIRKCDKFLTNYEIYIYSKEDALKFTNHVPLLHPAKIKRLKGHLTAR